MAALIGLYVLGAMIVILAGIAAYRYLDRAPVVSDRLVRRVSRRFGAGPGYAVILIVGLVFSVAVMIPIGILCRAAQSGLDSPTYRWVHPRVSPSQFTKLNTVLTTMGDRSTVDWIFVLALILLAFAYRRRWWIPVSALVLSYAAQYKGQVLLASWIDRGQPPGLGTGTFPSGGVSRALMLYGVTLVLTLHLFPALSRAWRTGLVTGLALLTFAEAYSRLYLSLHWISDILGGLIFGVLIIFSVSLAVRCSGTATTAPRSTHSSELRHELSSIRT